MKKSNLNKADIERMQAQEDVEGLVNALTHKNLEVRFEAIKALARIRRYEKMLEAFNQALRDESWQVRAKAVETMAELDNEFVVGIWDYESLMFYLLQALRDPNGSVRKCAEKALQKVEGTTRVKDKEKYVKGKEAESPGDAGNVQRLIQMLSDKDKNVRMSAEEDLIEIGEPLVEPLIQALKDKVNVIDHISVAKIFVKIGEPAVEPLLRALKDDDEFFQRRLLWILGVMRGPRAVEPLIQFIKNNPWRNLLFGLYLTFITDKRAIKPLIKALKDVDIHSRPGVEIALMNFGKSAVNPLIQALKDENKQVRITAAKILGNIGDERAVEALIQALKDENGQIREETATALGKIGNERAVEALTQALKDENEHLRTIAIKTLKRLGNRSAIEIFNQALREQTGMNEFERLNIIEKIIKNAINDNYLEDSDKADLREDFKKYDPIHYEKIIKKEGEDWFSEHLEEMEDELLYDAMEELFNYMQQGESKVRIRAMSIFQHALTASGGFIGEWRFEHAWPIEEGANQDKYWAFFVNSMGDDDERVREEAINAVKNFQISKKIPSLYHLLNDENPHIRRGAREALADMIEEAQVPEEAYGESGAPEWYWDAIRGNFEYEEYLEHLIEAAGQEDDEIRKKIVSDLERLDSLPSEVFLEKLNSHNKWVREFSAKMLKREKQEDKDEEEE